MKKKQVKLIDYFEINVYDKYSKDMLAGTELKYSSFEDCLLKIMQFHKRFPYKEIDIFIRPNHFGGYCLQENPE